MGFIIGLLIIGALIAAIFGRDSAKSVLGCVFWGAIIFVDIICVVISGIFFPGFFHIVLAVVALFLIVLVCMIVNLVRTDNQYSQRQREQRAKYQEQVARKDYLIKTNGIALGQALQQAQESEAIGLCRQLFGLEKPIPGPISDKVLTLLAAAIAEPEVQVKLCALRAIGGACDYRVWYQGGMGQVEGLSWEQGVQAYEHAIVSSNHPLSAVRRRVVPCP